MARRSGRAIRRSVHRVRRRSEGQPEYLASPGRMVALGGSDTSVSLESGAFGHCGWNAARVGDHAISNYLITLVRSHRQQLVGSPNLVLGHSPTLTERCDSRPSLAMTTHPISPAQVDRSAL